MGLDKYDVRPDDCICVNQTFSSGAAYQSMKPYFSFVSITYLPNRGVTYLFISRYLINCEYAYKVPFHLVLYLGIGPQLEPGLYGNTNGAVQPVRCQQLYSADRTLPLSFHHTHLPYIILTLGQIHLGSTTYLEQDTRLYIYYMTLPTFMQARTCQGV